MDIPSDRIVPDPDDDEDARIGATVAIGLGAICGSVVVLSLCWAAGVRLAELLGGR